MANKNIKINKKISTVTVIGLIIIALIIFFITNTPKPDSQASNQQTESNCGLLINDSCIALEVAATNQARIKGLSDRDQLNGGMLFAFEDPQEQCFWMKDMKFPLDMIWLNEHKEIIKLEENVLPDSYPQTYCADNTKYVLEFNSGFVQTYGLKTGQRLQFEHE